MSQLNIYRASAGSGKTYTLAREYIHLLFKNPFDYQHILAVTFTNKATAEMRQRILEKLYELGNEDFLKPDYMEELGTELSLSPARVRQRARLILKLLLHDFSRFSVSTIDSFFQQIIRSFARDAGLQMGFRTELNQDIMMLEAIDRVLLEMDMPGNEPVKRWLLSFAEKKISEGKSWNISREIGILSKEIFKEAYQSVSDELSRKLNDKAFMNEYLGQLQGIIDEYEKNLIQIGKDGLKIIEKWELNLNSDFFGGSRSKVQLFYKLAGSKTFKPEHIDALVDNPDIWTKKSNPSHVNQAIENAFNDGLNQLLHALIENRKGIDRDYYTALAILKNFHALGIINDVNNKIEEISREQNLFLLSGTNHLLTRIIQNDEAPFIYERTGSRYAHFMIDEFQDTSALQYANFKPLLLNSLSQGHSTLLVGDVKQSIYRWRNSDWTLLSDRVEQNFRAYESGIHTLDTNWRSMANVIQFNNQFFTGAALSLQNQLAGKIPDDLKQEPSIQLLQNRITEAYHDVIQKKAPHHNSETGHATFQFFEETKNKDEFREQATIATLKHIEDLTNSGFKYSEICLLVRTREEGVHISNALLSGDYHSQNKSLPVISNETLQLKSSAAVLFVINHLKYIQNPGDKILEAFLRVHLNYYQNPTARETIDASEVFHNTIGDKNWHTHLGFINDKRQMPLYDLTDELIRLLPHSVREEESLYLQTLLNSVNAFSSRQPTDLSLFLDEWDKSGQFESVMVPESQEAIRVMTIHKSKGLEFRAVVLPFCNWSLESVQLDHLLWCAPKKSPFNELTLIPVNYKRTLLNSHFVYEYLEEMMHQYIDNLNLLYVAFTRARESLAAFSNLKKNAGLTTVSDLLYTHFISISNNESFGNWNEEDLTFSVGDLTSLRDETHVEKDKMPGKDFFTKRLGFLETFSLEDRVEIHLESSDYFDDPDEQVKSLTYGKVMHRIFEKIITFDDIPHALKELWFEGKITSEESKTLQQQMTTWLQHPIAKNWFNGSYKVLTEVAILDKTVRRPDRVMIGDDSVVVVDYKFGKSDMHKHQIQVKDYMGKIKNMGYQNVEGYIWYVPFKEVVTVKKLIG